jgi:hypothetical protein
LETSKSLLSINWNGAAPSFAEQVANRAAAIDELANGDPRPLLIQLQLTPESDKADQDVEPLLTAALKSERFQLASKWFNCVTVDESVLEKTHPYHSLFDGRNPGRLVLASRDGSKVVDFLGTGQQRVSWSSIASVLRKDYKKDPTSAVKGMERLLSKFDALDNQRKELNAQLERYTKKNQQDKMKAYEKKIAANEKERTALLEQKAKLEDLALRSADAKDDKKAD